MAPDANGPATVTGTAADLLLWIYRCTEVPADQLERVAEFRALSATD